MKHIRLVVALVATLAAAQALAVPAAPFPVQLRNEDGTAFMGRLFGDEHLSWAEDLEGHPIKFDETTGAWHYATLGSDGRFEALPWRVGVADPARLNLQKHLKPSPAARRRALMRRSTMQRTTIRPAPPQGKLRNLVLLVQFNCSSEAGGCSPTNQGPTFSAADFLPVFNGATDSLKAYYEEVSYGKLQLESEIATGAWIELPYNDAYYAYNDEVDGCPACMLVDGINHLIMSGFDFTRFDLNRDGVLDALTIIHVGHGYEYSGQPRDIHSHFQDLSQFDLRVPGDILLTGYHTEPEFQADKVHITTIGVICHETAHFFGLPDLYDYTGTSAGVGDWSIMASGSWAGPSSAPGSEPTHLDAWSKSMLGFLTPTKVAANASGLRLEPTANKPQAVRIDTGSPNQYFLLENRYETKYDRYVPGSGLAIYHVDENQQDNDDSDHYLVDVEQADGLRELNTSRYESGDLGDVWPYDSKKAFTPDSKPNTLAYGASSSRISVLNITRVGHDVTFDVEIEGTAPKKPNGQAISSPGLIRGTGPRDGVPGAVRCPLTPLRSVRGSSPVASARWSRALPRALHRSPA
jgi:immune inhibitor A